MKKTQLKGIVIFLLVIMFFTSVSAQVSIVKLSGTPKITSCVKDVVSYGGYSDRGTLAVKNIGDQAGSFYVTAECNKGGVDVGGTGSRNLIESGKEDTFNLLISGTNTDKENPLVAICTYTINDLNSDKKDSCVSSVIVKYCGVCQPNSEICQNGNLLRCKEPYCEYSLKQQCKEGCGWAKRVGMDKCKEDIPKPNYSFIIYIVIFIMFVIIIVYLYSKLSKKKLN